MANNEFVKTAVNRLASITSADHLNRIANSIQNKFARYHLNIKDRLNALTIWSKLLQKLYPYFPDIALGDNRISYHFEFEDDDGIFQPYTVEMSFDPDQSYPTPSEICRAFFALTVLKACNEDGVHLFITLVIFATVAIEYNTISNLFDPAAFVAILEEVVRYEEENIL